MFDPIFDDSVLVAWQGPFFSEIARPWNMGTFVINFVVHLGPGDPFGGCLGYIYNPCNQILYSKHIFLLVCIFVYMFSFLYGISLSIWGVFGVYLIQTISISCI